MASKKGKPPPPPVTCPYCGKTFVPGEPVPPQTSEMHTYFHIAGQL